MSLFYQIVFVVLAAEMLLFTLLIAPLPLAVRRPMLKWMSTSPLVTQAKSWLKLVFVYVTIMFVDSLNKVLRKSSNEDHRPDTDPYHRARLFYEQRNLYLTGAVLFLSLLLNRFFAMISELMANETKADALKKQAAKQSTDYLIEELSTKAKEVDIIKRQAKQTHDEYMRLTDRYVELERKAGGSDDARKSR
ncbi:B-cell receptor-associated protein 31-like-domain-containing protein [Powellomyces hirtus]|nr:B-cell receptor-associated protein 31-like-domain-containing protein [Powellomyces hirtus]